MDAELSAQRRRHEVEEFLKLPQMVQLIRLVNPDVPQHTICSADMNSALKIITKILMDIGNK